MLLSPTRGSEGGEEKLINSFTFSSYHITTIEGAMITLRKYHYYDSS